MHKYSFGKIHRLNQKSVITQLFERGSFWRKGAYKFKYLPIETGQPELLISISKRVGNSPQRNKLKRLIREAVRSNDKFKGLQFQFSVFITNRLEQPPSLTKLQEIITEFFDHLYENTNQ